VSQNQSHLELDATYDAVFECDLCEFKVHGPGELETHIKEMHSVPVSSVDGVTPNSVNADPYRRRR
jgi:hypothetical protein